MFDAFAGAYKAGDTTDDHAIIGLALSRPGGERNLRKLNLLDSDAVSTFFRDIKPNCEPSSVQFTVLLGNQPGGWHPSWRGVLFRNSPSPFNDFFFCRGPPAFTFCLS